MFCCSQDNSDIFWRVSLKSEIAASRLVQNNRRSQGGKGLCPPKYLYAMPCSFVLREAVSQTK